MKILITGICGFVGSTLARAWLEAEAGLSIYGMDSLTRPGSEANRIGLQKLGAKLFHGDIRVASDFESLPTVDWVIDAAANPSVLAGVDGRTSSRQLVEHNLQGTVNILEYCRSRGAGFILLSTSRVYSLASLSAVRVEAEGNAFRLSPGQQLPPGVGPSALARRAARRLRSPCTAARSWLQRSWRSSTERASTSRYGSTGAASSRVPASSGERIRASSRSGSTPGSAGAR